MPLMVGVIFVSAVIILALNLLIDLTYSLVDPRITRVSSRMADVPVRRFA
jgi:ABC-type dipeptide/oligopeptide/nickel transport system permease component